VDPTGRFLYVANRGSSNISAFAINSAIGLLTLVTGSPFDAGPGAAPTSVAADNSGKLLFVANHDSHNVSVYRIDGTSGALTPLASARAGTNPTAVTAAPSMPFVYVTSETSDKVTAYKVNVSTGALTEVNGSPFVAGNSPQFAAVDISGQYLYVINQFSDDVTVYAINPATGALRQVGQQLPQARIPLGLPQPAPLNSSRSTTTVRRTVTVAHGLCRTVPQPDIINGNRGLRMGPVRAAPANWLGLNHYSLAVSEGMAGTTGLEPTASAVTEYHDLEIQALTGNLKERKVLKTHRREFLLFP
jgi:hypothetical protein